MKRLREPVLTYEHHWAGGRPSLPDLPWVPGFSDLWPLVSWEQVSPENRRETPDVGFPIPDPCYFLHLLPCLYRSLHILSIKTRGCSGQTDTKILMEMEKKLIFEQS